jgi:protein involved in plasmid replication-relaxation
VIKVQKGARARRGSGRPSRSDALGTVTELDRQLIEAVSSQRVVTQSQLERLFSNTPGRTLRYRTERLTKRGLLGRSRPYRDKGSAPFHFWPTRVADAFARGEPVPRGGERREPNPQFLAHAAGLSELYVLLAAQAPSHGLRLRDFEREGEAREPFYAGDRGRALAPDVLVELEDERGRRLFAFVELDLGTMSHARLKTKAAGYAAYAAEAAWTKRHPFCPCLLFLTTTEARALSFLKGLQALLEKAARGGYYERRGNVGWFAAGACAHAREPERALVEACWDDLALAGGGLTLLDCLNAARAPYDAARAKQAAERRALEHERARLRADHDARRAYLQEKRIYARDDHLDQFGPAGETALRLLLHFGEPMNDVERDAFAALARQLADDPLDAHFAPAPVPPTASDTEAIARLVACYRAREQARVAELARRYGEGPRLRRRRSQLAAGELIEQYGWDALEQEAERDHQARAEQERLRASYLERREREARRRKHEASLASRLARGRAASYAVVDRDLLNICPRCDEIAYPPDPNHTSRSLIVYSAAYREPRCHFCGSSELVPWQERYLPQLEYGGGYRPLGGDLPSSGTDGLMDDPDKPKGGHW